MFAIAACSSGAVGPQGPAGDSGSQGGAGQTGASGSTGLSGATGPAGPAGPAGSAGARGQLGSTGPKGSSGSAGPAGAVGLSGADAASRVIVPLLELNSSGQTGIARLISRGVQTEVIVELNAGALAVLQPMHVHAGSCTSLGGVDYPLTSVVDGFSSTIIDVSLPALREGQSTINVHKSGTEAGTYVACGDIPAAGTTVTFALNEQNDSGQAGSATLIADGNTTMVVLNVAAGPFGVTQPVHIHAGSCDTLGGVEFPLQNVENGRSVTVVSAAMSSLLGGNRTINLHKSGPEIGVYTSCGDIPETTVQAASGTTSAAVTLALGELNSSGQTGTVTLTARGTRTDVSVDITPGEVGVNQPAHIHLGSCDTLGGVQFPLTDLQGGKSSTVVQASMTSLLTGRFTVNIHKSLLQISTYVACGNIPSQADVLTVSMSEMNSSSQSGTATLVAVGDKTNVVINVSAGAAGVAQPIHIHTGSCDTVGGVEHALTSVMNGQSVTTVDASLDSLRAGQFVVNLHKSGPEASVYTACGSLNVS